MPKRLTKIVIALSIFISGAVLALGVAPLYAHAFGQRYDLPIPLNYFLAGAAATVALSFVVLGFFVQSASERITYPKLNLLTVPVLGAVLSGRIAGTAVRILSVAIFALLLFAGFFGTERAIENVSPVFIWIIWWVGMGYVVALFGNVWSFLNPWKITFEWYRRVRGHAGEPEDPPFDYPEWMDVWPALVLFFMFAWAENVFTAAYQPRALAVMVLLYSVLTWAGMAAFGKHTWLRNGEAFAVLFGFFARFSPTETRVINRAVCAVCYSSCRLESERSDCVDCYDCWEYAAPQSRRLNLRPPAIGLALQRRVPVATAAFVILALATVSFDGFQDTKTWADARTAMLAFASLDVVDTLALTAAPLAFALVYLIFAWGIKALSGDEGGILEVAGAYVFSLVPIALAYNLAHFITLLLIQGQLIIPVASDPFGYGWDIFGTKGYLVNLQIISARTVWFISLAAIVLGHVISVYLAHLISLRRAASASSAMRGQIPMLALMILYTATSLWIIAQPIVG